MDAKKPIINVEFRILQFEMIYQLKGISESPQHRLMLPVMNFLLASTWNARCMVFIIH